AVEFYILEAREVDGLRLILDRCTLEKERDLAKRIELVSSYYEEDVVDGVVERITEYGAIVKIKIFVTGILHKRNIAFNQVENVEDFVRVGDTLKLKIIKINPQTGKMALSLKALKANPWDSVDVKYKIDSIVNGK
ncbi:S1 RNA-binding domain-containing protein, partial [Borreliella burgdorferi]|uniref:S1 RNA-binding domain-containing protein n=1 Tax=Borreliella burgdorferi TaxID=139 RepID=UPI00216099CA